MKSEGAKGKMNFWRVQIQELLFLVPVIGGFLYIEKIKIVTV
jgi:hypothetical protein